MRRGRVHPNLLLSRGRFARLKDRRANVPFPSPPCMYAIAIVRYRCALDDVLVHIDDHRAYLRSLKDAGTLIASGPVEPRSGGVLLLRVPDEDSAAALDRIRDEDPFSQRGIAQYELMKWMPVIGKEDLDKL